ncbi:MAG: hypothetical protein HY704_08290 [Gemmatimonadetes bacterium]|nr:hypothetical protein [Gemmatimonadota bacterium]
MADTVRRVEYYYVTVPNKPGEGAHVLEQFKAAGVNLLAFHAFPSGRRAQLDFFPEDAAAFKAAARKAKLRLSARKTGFLAEGDDRVGVVAEILEKLAAAKVNVIAMDAVCSGGGRYGALFWVDPRQVRKAARVLGAQ